MFVLFDIFFSYEQKVIALFTTDSFLGKSRSLKKATLLTLMRTILLKRMLVMIFKKKKKKKKKLHKMRRKRRSQNLRKLKK
jgi:hypothetical protein